VRVGGLSFLVGCETGIPGTVRLKRQQAHHDAIVSAMNINGPPIFGPIAIYQDFPEV